MTSHEIVTPAPRILTPNENVAEHPVANTAHYAGDLALLNYLLHDLRVLLRRAVKGEIELTPQQVLSWDVHGLERRTVVCDPARLTEHGDVCVVGFFGDRRSLTDESSVDASEHDLIGEFIHHPGILSYSSIELVDHYWANLVVHLAPDDREMWRDSEVHRHAVDTVAPAAYHGVRIHNGGVVGGILASETVVIASTKYWNYDVTPVWHAVRELPGVVSTPLVGPVTVPT